MGKHYIAGLGIQEEGKGMLGANAMKRVAAGAHLPTIGMLTLSNQIYSPSSRFIKPHVTCINKLRFQHYCKNTTAAFTNIALKKVAKLTSIWPGKYASNGVDGDILTYAHTGTERTFPVWFYVDLGETACVDHIRIYNRPGHGEPDCTLRMALMIVIYDRI